MRRSLKDLTVKQLEKRVDAYFSYFIRLRDSDREGYAHCCTCSRRFFWKALDCGHYSKRNKAHRFNERNCNAQCNYCNDRMKGEADKHARFIDLKYGDGTAEYLRSTEKQINKKGRVEMLALLEEYKSKAKSEASKRGLNIYN